MNSISVHRVSIERIVRHNLGGKVEAEFKAGEWYCCEAWIDCEGQHIQTRGTKMTPEQASTVAIAIQMALEWLGEEMY